jgi:uncharacterized protein (TIGR03067 family)
MIVQLKQRSKQPLRPLQALIATRLKPLCAASVAAVLVACAAPQPSPPSILGEPMRAAVKRPVVDPELIGTWSVKRAEMGGKPFATPPGFELKLSEDRYGAGVDGNYGDRGRIELFGDELAGEPRRLDVVGEVGPNKGKRIPALYRLNGRELEIVYDLSGQDRPRNFESREGTMLFRVTYQRKN